MNILQTPVRFHPFVGGVEKYVLTLSQELAARNHSVTVVCANEPRSPSSEIVNGIRVKRLPYIGKVANTNITPTLPLALLSEDYDVVHTHLPTPWAADWSAFAAMLRKKPLVLTYHNDIVGTGGNAYVARLYNQTLLKIALRIADRIVVTRPGPLSPFLEPYAEKVVVVPNSVDTTVFTPRRVEPMADIFFLSVLDEYHRYKGLDTLLRALELVKREYPGVTLVVGGSGPLRGYYEAMAASLGLSENVDFVGYIPDEDLADYYRGCRLFVLPSTDPAQEGFGIVLLEAMACGRPVVTTSITGVADDIRRMGAGKVVEPDDADALSHAIAELLRDDDESARMCDAGRGLVEAKYSCKRVAEQMEAIYMDLLL